jgi:hypothetical protein
MQTMLIAVGSLTALAATICSLHPIQQVDSFRI